MQCVSVNGLLAFLRGLRVLHVFDAATGAMLQRVIPPHELVDGVEIPTHKGWKRIAQARANSRSHQRPRKRH